MSANVSDLVFLRITCSDIEVEIAYYIAVSHNHYFPINIKVYKSYGTCTSILNRNIGGAYKTLY